jgi:hypothetical protein
MFDRRIAETVEPSHQFADVRGQFAVLIEKRELATQGMHVFQAKNIACICFGSKELIKQDRCGQAARYEQTLNLFSAIGDIFLASQSIAAGKSVGIGNVPVARGDLTGDGIHFGGIVDQLFGNLSFLAIDSSFELQSISGSRGGGGFDRDSDLFHDLEIETLQCRDVGGRVG